MSSSIQRAIRYNVYRRSLGYYEDLPRGEAQIHIPSSAHKYRNSPVNFILNGNFEKGRMGNLIILDDRSYTKSVFLDAIPGFNNKNEQGDIEGDKCSYWWGLFPWKTRFLETAICYINDKHVAEYVIDDENRGKWREYDIPEHIHADISIDTVKSELKAIATILNGNKELEYHSYLPCKEKDYTDSNYFACLISHICLLFDHNFSYYEEEIFDAYQYLEDKYSNIKQNTDDSESIWDKIVSRNFETVTAYMNFKRVDAENTVDDSLSDQFEKRLSEKLGVPAIPTVHRYSYNGKYREDLSRKYRLNREEIKNLKTGDSPKLKFWRAFFNSVENFSIDRIIAAYEQTDAIEGTLINGRRVLPVYARSTESKKIIKDIQKELQPRLDELTDLYNSYFADTGYEIDALKVDFDLQGMKLCALSPLIGSIEDDDQYINQSNLKLDFFFNFIADNNLKPGDIVIMDDSAIQNKYDKDMSPQEQAAYRKFIKDFAVKNDILVIITTRSPFLIDQDNYEEVITGNYRDFYDFRWNMLTTHLSATLRENPETTLVWVDNMTTYIYLTMFKKIFGIENMAFIPGHPDSNTYLTREMRDLTKNHRNIILTNGDDKGRNRYNEYKQQSSDYTAIYNLNMIMIDDGTPGDRPAWQIEDLFSIEDQEKYGDIINSNCHDFNVPKIYEPNYKYRSGKSALDILKAAELKIHAKEEDFSEETIRNFKKLFKLLHSELIDDVVAKNKEKILDMIFTKHNEC